MKHFFFVVFTTSLLASCTQSKPVEFSSVDDKDTEVTLKNDVDSVKFIAAKAMKALKAKDYVALSTTIHPASGVRFSRYGIVAASDVPMLPGQFIENIRSKAIFTWGTEENSKRQIRMDIPTYLSSFVYDADFLKANQISFNASAGKGNTIDLIQKNYVNDKYLEYYLSDAFAENAEWKTLTFVFENYKNQYYIVGMIHNQGTKKTL